MKHLLETTSAAAMEVIQQSTHDLPFNMGAFGEAFCSLPWLFVGSTSKLDPVAEPEQSMNVPLPNESFVTLEWTLPMSGSAQAMLFQRVLSSFNRETGMVPLASKRKYRAQPTELLRLRNMVCLFDQLLGHLRSRLGEDEVQGWINEVIHGVGKDDDLMNLIQTQPKVFCLSMSLSERQKAQKSVQEIEAKKVEHVAQQRMQVTVAQWQYFCAALEQDHAEIEKLRIAPALVRQKLHAKQVAHRAKQIATAEAACTSYQEMDCHGSSKNIFFL